MSRLNVIKKNIGSMFRLNVQVICDKEKIGSMSRLNVPDLSGIL